MVAVKLIGLKSHAKCYRVRGAYAILPRVFVRRQRRCYACCSSKSSMPESPTSDYISCLPNRLRLLEIAINGVLLSAPPYSSCRP